MYLCQSKPCRKTSLEIHPLFAALHFFHIHSLSCPPLIESHHGIMRNDILLRALHLRIIPNQSLQTYYITFVTFSQFSSRFSLFVEKRGFSILLTPISPPPQRFVSELFSSTGYTSSSSWGNRGLLDYYRAQLADLCHSAYS